jgi:hypothetical protein
MHTQEGLDTGEAADFVDYSQFTEQHILALSGQLSM